MTAVQEQEAEEKGIVRENERAERKIICMRVYERLYESNLGNDELQRIGNHIGESVTAVENRA